MTVAHCSIHEACRALCMKKLINAAFALLLATAFLPLSAQQNRCKVTGVVSAANDHTLPYVSVYISKHDSVMVGTMTNLEGRFEMEIAQTKDSCLLTVVFMGYKTKQVPFFGEHTSSFVGHYSYGLFYILSFSSLRF